MAWVKIDDKFRQHPKVIAAGLEASWWYVCALTYCGEHLTDGFVPEGMTNVLAPHLADPVGAADRCCAVGLLERVEGGFRIPDYLEYNPTRDKVVAEREAARVRQKSRRDSRRTDGDGSASPYPYPSPESVVNPPSSGELGDGGCPQGVAEVVEYLTDVAEAGAARVDNRTGWRRKVRRRLMSEHGVEAAEICSLYPQADARSIGNAIIDQDRRSLSRFRERTTA